jgi:hypothetical protein
MKRRTKWLCWISPSGTIHIWITSQVRLSRLPRMANLGHAIQMRLSDTDIQDFKTLYTTRFGIVLTDSEARTQATALISLLSYVNDLDDLLATWEDALTDKQ